MWRDWHWPDSSPESGFPPCWSRKETLEILARVGRENSDATVLFHATMASLLELHPTDYKVLGILQRLGPLSAGEIARHSGLAPASVTNLIEPYSDRDLAVIADFLGRNAERLRTETAKLDAAGRKKATARPWRPHCVEPTCRIRGTPFDEWICLHFGRTHMSYRLGSLLVALACLFAATAGPARAFAQQAATMQPTDARKSAPARNGHMMVNSVEHYHTIHGRGEPLVLSHGRRDERHPDVSVVREGRAAPGRVSKAARPDGRVDAQALRLVGRREEARDAGAAHLWRQRHVPPRAHRAFLSVARRRTEGCRLA